MIQGILSRVFVFVFLQVVLMIFIPLDQVFFNQVAINQVDFNQVDFQGILTLRFVRIYCVEDILVKFVKGLLVHVLTRTDRYYRTILMSFDHTQICFQDQTLAMIFFNDILSVGSEKFLMFFLVRKVLWKYRVSLHMRPDIDSCALKLTLRRRLFLCIPLINFV